LTYETGTGDGAARENAHSRMGVASFVIAILATVLLVALFVAGGLVAASAFENVDPQTLDPESVQSSPAFAGLALIGIGVFGCLVLYIVGLGLGVAGLIQRTRKRLFSALGTALNGLVLAAMFILFALGSLVGA
jgi:di/tricarboxylate transporter